MSYKSDVAESRHKVRLSLTATEAAWLQKYLDGKFPDEKETNAGVARAGTHVCNPNDISWIAGTMVSRVKKGRGISRTIAIKMARIAERTLLPGRRVRLI